MSGRLVSPSPAEFFRGLKGRTVGIPAVADGLQVVVDAFEGERVGRPYRTLAPLPKTRRWGTPWRLWRSEHAQAAQFLAPQLVVQERRQDGLSPVGP